MYSRVLSSHPGHLVSWSFVLFSLQVVNQIDQNVRANEISSKLNQKCNIISFMTFSISYSCLDVKNG